MDRVEEFINRRFYMNCDWMRSNSYFFALILKSVFSGRIVYDPVAEHFLLSVDGVYYDWIGRKDYEEEHSSNFLDWNTYLWEYPSHASKIMRDCIL